MKSWSHCDFWIVPLPYPPNVSSLLPTCYSRNTVAQHSSYLRTVGGAKSRNFPPVRLVWSVLVPNKISCWQTNLQCQGGSPIWRFLGQRLSSHPLLFKFLNTTMAQLSSQKTRRIRVQVADNLLPEQKLFPATPAMEQWGWDLDTRVVGWEMLTG